VGGGCGGNSPILSAEERKEEEEGLGSLGRSFLYHLELGGGETCHLLAPLTCGQGGGALEARGGAVPDYA
jgi:hypothetical protein